MESVQSLIEYSKELNRVCPQPRKWNELYQMLPDKKQKPNGGWEPSLPLILAAWYETPALMKMLRLQEHIEWASNHECLDKIGNYLRSLPENEWFHLGE